MVRLGVVPKILVLLVIFGGIIGSQYSYDLTKKAPLGGLAGILSPSIVRMFDMGFHSTVASFLWISTMPKIIDLFRGRTGYVDDVAFLNAVDPKMSYPYAFSVLTLPAAKSYKERVSAAMEIGQRGLANADPDWRIPFYMATNYYLEFKDNKSAQVYYDIAANTPGVPFFAKRFALNFGIKSSEREKTRALWEAIRDTTNDGGAKERAQAYIDRLTIFDYLDAASRAYRQKFGSYPATPEELVTKKIIPALPQDPFGFTFYINGDGTAGIDFEKEPSSL